MDFLKKFSNKRKMKYGAVLAGFLAIIIAIVILVNAIVSLLTDRFNWRFDMTDEQIYSASPEFITAMTDINKNAEIEIVFFDSKDKIESSYSSSLGNGVGLAYVNQTATQLAEKLDNVKVSYHSTDDYEYVNQFKLATGNQAITEETVVVMRTDVEKPADGKLTQFEIYTVGSFYVSDSNGDLFAYNGEVMLVEASIRLTTDDEPVVYFVINHDEAVEDVVNSDGEFVQATTIKNLTGLFINAGYSYRPIDLSEKIYLCTCGKQYSPMWDWGIDINDENTKLETVIDELGNEKTLLATDFKCNATNCGNTVQKVYLEDLEKRAKMPTDARAVVIYEPKKDFEDSEIRLIESYLSKQGAVMTFLEPSVSYAEMSNFYGFLKMWGGINVNTSKVTDAFNSVNGGFEAVVPSNDATKAYFPTLSNSYSKPVFNNSIYLTIDENKLPENANTGDHTFTQTESLIKTSNVASQKNATLMCVTNTVNTVTNQGGGIQGTVDFSSYLVVCASGDFADDSHIISAPTNTKILRSLVRSTTTKQIYPTDVEFKVFNNYDLDITTSESVAVLFVTMTLIPAIALITGFIVIFRRKRR